MPNYTGTTKILVLLSNCRSTLHTLTRNDIYVTTAVGSSPNWWLLKSEQSLMGPNIVGEKWKYFNMETFLTSFRSKNFLSKLLHSQGIYIQLPQPLTLAHSIGLSTTENQVFFSCH